MYYFGDLEFDIKYTGKDFVQQIPQDNYDKFIIAYSTLEQVDIALLDVDARIALAEYIYNTINFTNEDTFLNLLNKNIHQINNDLKSLAIHLLSQIDYKVGEMYEWDYKKIFYVLFLEVAKNPKLRDLFVEYAPKYFPEEKQQKLSETLQRVFPKPQTESNQIQDNSTSDNNNQELIDALNRL